MRVYQFTHVGRKRKHNIIGPGVVARYDQQKLMICTACKLHLSKILSNGIIS
jgi:hypothetical protein